MVGGQRWFTLKDVLALECRCLLLGPRASRASLWKPLLSRDRLNRQSSELAA